MVAAHMVESIDIYRFEHTLYFLEKNTKFYKINQ